MANAECEKLVSAEARRRCERRHARLMFGVAFPLCLLVAALARLMPRSKRDAYPFFDRRHSLFRQASNAASMCIPFAFR